MPEMSADVEHPNLSASAVEAATAPTDRAPEHPQSSLNGEPEAPHHPTTASTTSPVPAHTTLPASADAPRWRLATIGYVLLLLGFGLALTIPSFRVRAGIREEALVILSIGAMLAAAGAIVASFVLNLLRDL